MILSPPPPTHPPPPPPPPTPKLSKKLNNMFLDDEECVCTVNCEADCKLDELQMNPEGGDAKSMLGRGGDCVNTQTGSVGVRVPQSNTVLSSFSSMNPMRGGAVKPVEGGGDCVNTQTGSVGVADPQSNTVMSGTSQICQERAMPQPVSQIKPASYERVLGMKYCPGMEWNLPTYTFQPYKPGTSRRNINRFSFGQPRHAQERSHSDSNTISIIECGGQEESVAGGGSHRNEDPPSHGTWVMSVPTSTTLPEKGWEWRGEAGMPSAVGPGDHTSDKGGRGERRKSQKFMDLCNRYEVEGGAKGELDGSLSVRTVIWSEDTMSMGGVSKLSSNFKQDVKIDPQTSNFSSLRDV